MKHTVSIVIPNYNGLPMLQKHLPSVIEAAYGAEVIVVDDGSTDESVTFLNANYKNITVIAKDRNDGFASTVNSGVDHASGDIVVLLNTDVEPEKDFLKPLTHHFSDSSVFAVGCLEISHEKDKTVERGRGIARWEKGLFIHSRGETNRTDTAWVSGGSGAFRRVIWDKLGGMDTRFDPFYWEDIDISTRAVEQGYRIVFESKSTVHHFHETGSIAVSYSKQQIKRISYRNQFLFCWKHCAHASMCFAHIVWLPYHIVRHILIGDWDMVVGMVLAVFRMFH